MLRFDVYQNGAPAQDVDLSGAYMFGQDGIPVRAELAAAGNRITCAKRIAGACGLALLRDVGRAGKYMLATTRLPEQNEPYNLNVELARAQIMKITQKREDWGLFDYVEANKLNSDFAEVRQQFVDALKASDPAEAARLADVALENSVTLGEKIALFHAEIFLKRRKSSVAATSRTSFGGMVDLFSTSANYQDRLREAYDFVSVPIPWKHLEPKERKHDFTQVDSWVNWSARCKKPIHAGPLLSFEPKQLPEWLYIWEHDYEALRDLIYDNIQQIVKRYERHVRVWNVVSGIHAYNSFNLNFEQLMELTRMSCLLVKKLAPNSQVMIDLVMPWGEYYARNQRTIPPLLYADMAVQSGIKFDAFGVQIYMGSPVDGHYVRDLLQISSLLDEFVGFGKTVHISGTQVPSSIEPDTWDAWQGQAAPMKAGRWHSTWSPRLQAEWLQAFYRISISKPFVDSVSWRDLGDYEGHYIPHGGLCKGDLEPKLAYKELRNFKAFLESTDIVIDQQDRNNKNRSSE